jgi:hypothetical protein
MINLNTQLKLPLKLILISGFLLIIALATKLSIFKINSFISGYFADFLVVIILILWLKLILPKLQNLKVIGIILVFSFFIEFTQLLNQNFQILKIDNFLLQIIVGSNFDFWDLIVYIFGTIVGYKILEYLA